MTTTVLQPNITTTANGTVTGAANAHTALADSSDASYVAPAEVFTVGLSTYTLPTGAITKSIQLTGRRNGRSGGATLHYGSGSYSESYSVDPGTPTAFSFPSRQVSLTQANIDNAYVTLYREGGSNTPIFYKASVTLVTVARPTTLVTAVSPDPYTASTMVPVSWTNTLDADGGAQTRYQLRVLTQAQVDAPGFNFFTATPFYDSGELIGSTTSSTVGPLPNGQYRVYVRVGQTVNGATHWSAWPFDTFTVTVSTSDVSSVVAVPVDADGKIGVTVTRNGASQAWSKVEVQRSIDAGTTWAQVRGATLADATGHATVFTVDDHETPNGQATIYRARATWYSSGLPITGAWTQSSSVSWTGADHWLKAPLSPALNATFDLYGRAPQNRDVPSGVFDVIGGTFPVVVSDGLRSPRSSFTVRVEGVARRRELLDLLDSGALLANFLPGSYIGESSNGFEYISVVNVSEDYVTDYYLTGDQLHDFSIAYIAINTPPDATAGTL